MGDMDICCRRQFYWNIHGYRAPPAHTTHFANRTRRKIIDFPDPDDWLYTMNCSKCAFPAATEYLLCVKDGHLTCLDCAVRYQNLRCEFVPPIVKALESRDLETAVGGRFRPAQFAKTNKNAELRRSRSYDNLLLKGAKCGALLLVQPTQFITKLQTFIFVNCPYKWAGCCELLPASKLRHHVYYICEFRLYNLTDCIPPAFHWKKNSSPCMQFPLVVTEIVDETASQPHYLLKSPDLQPSSNIHGSEFLPNPGKFEFFRNMKIVQHDTSEENLSVISPEEMDKEKSSDEMDKEESSDEIDKDEISDEIYKKKSYDGMDKEKVSYCAAPSIDESKKNGELTLGKILVPSTIPLFAESEDVEMENVSETEVANDLPSPFYYDSLIQNESDSTPSSEHENLVDISEVNVTDPDCIVTKAIHIPEETHSEWCKIPDPSDS